MNTIALPKAIIFDLGAVIVDIDFNRIFAAWSAASGVPADTIRQRYSVDEAYRQHERGLISGPTYFASLRQSLGLDLDDATFESGWNAIFGGEVAGIAERILRARRIAPCFVFSNTNATHQTYWARELAPTLSLFVKVFVSNEIGERKPDRAAFDAVCAMTGIAPAHSLFFDDSEENVQGARLAGLTAVRVDSIADIDRTLDGLEGIRPGV